MKKITSFVLMLCFVLSATVAFAAANREDTTGLVGQIRTAQDTKNKTNSKNKAPVVVQPSRATRENAPKVAIMYENNAKSTYDKELDNKIFAFLNKKLPAQNYVLIDGTPFMAKLRSMGYADMSTAERADIIEAYANTDVDYCIYLEVGPLVARDKITVFTIGKDITTTVSFRIIDIAAKKYIYTGKFVEKASDSTVIGGVGNKSVALKALESACKKMGAVIDEKMPK